MALAVLCRTVRSRWQALTQLVWPDTPEERTRTEIRQLTKELARRYQRLVRRRCRIEQVRDRLREQERRIAELCERVYGGGARARELALSLERWRQVELRNRDRLRRHEDAYGRQRAIFEQKKQLRLALERGQAVVAEDRQEE